LKYLNHELRDVELDAREYNFDAGRVGILLGAMDRLLAAKGVYKQAYSADFCSLVVLLRAAVRAEDARTICLALQVSYTVVTRVGFPETRKRAKEYNQVSREKLMKDAFFKADG